jgi:nitrate/nitrite-specific signal transduction histidine kinase
MPIKLKMILLFVVLKVVPLFLIAWAAIEGARSIALAVSEDSKQMVEQSTGVIEATADLAIADSIEALDRKSQEALELWTAQVAQTVARFLYSIDADLLALAQSGVKPQSMHAFFEQKRRRVTVPPAYRYDDEAHRWVPQTGERAFDYTLEENARLPENRREFNKKQPATVTSQRVPIYKEITFFDTTGQERHKLSRIDETLYRIDRRENTYLKAESYFDAAVELERGEIYVSEVIGAYTPSPIIGPVTQPSAQKAGVPFEPEKMAYAGVENPVGRRFEGIVRFVTPVYEEDRRVGYLSLALDHIHLREFVAYLYPNTRFRSNIADATEGNYAFMWDYLGRSVVHPRDHSISGFDPQSGERVPGWVSADLAQRWEAAGRPDLNRFLEGVTPFEAQSHEKRPNMAQVKSGLIPLDCRYLNFAPQCDGWFQLVGDGGYGSFVIEWSGVWKLTTAAAIPYYTGRYGDRKVGFGFVTMGANLEEFHEAANQTRAKVDEILAATTGQMQTIVGASRNQVATIVRNTIKDITLATAILTVLVVLVALWLASHITRRIRELIRGSEAFAANDLDYRIVVRGRDEFATLAGAFNTMAAKIRDLISAQRRLNEELEERVEEKTRNIRLLLDNAGQGFLAFGPSLVIEPGYSRECEAIFNRSLDGVRFSALVFKDHPKRAGFYDKTFEKILTLHDRCRQEALLGLLDTEYRVGEQILQAEYRLIHSPRQMQLMVILTDITRERSLEKRALQEHETTLMLYKALTQPAAFAALVQDLRSFCNQRLGVLIRGEGLASERLKTLFREVHTLKGNSMQFNLTSIASALECFENTLASLRKGDQQRVQLNQLDRSEELQSALAADLALIERHLGSDFFENSRTLRVDPALLRALRGRLMTTLEGKERQEVVMMVNEMLHHSLAGILMRFDESITRLADRLGKRVESLQVVGDLPVDTRKLIALESNLIHLIRNSLDHGIEPPQERELLGKPVCGRLTFEIRTSEETLTLIYRDDGQGVDEEAVAAKARREGLVVPEVIDGVQLLKLLCHDGLSTRESSDEISGRGVGMAALRMSLEAMGGTLVLENHPGAGTVFVMSLPRSAVQLES